MRHSWPGSRVHYPPASVDLKPEHEGDVDGIDIIASITRVSNYFVYGSRAKYASKVNINGNTSYDSILM